MMAEEQGACHLCGSPEWVFRGDIGGGSGLEVACELCGERRPVRSA